MKILAQRGETTLAVKDGIKLFVVHLKDQEAVKYPYTEQSLFARGYWEAITDERALSLKQDVLTILSKEDV